MRRLQKLGIFNKTSGQFCSCCEKRDLFVKTEYKERLSLNISKLV